MFVLNIKATTESTVYMKYSGKQKAISKNLRK